MERYGYILSMPFLSTLKQQQVATRIVRANRTIRDAVAHFQKRYSSGDVEESEILSRIIHAKDPETGRRMTFETICMEARGFILAASDTTANTLIMAIYHISRTPGVWQRLHDELKIAIPSADILFDSVNETSNFYQDLPFLSACVKETYRLSPAIAKLLPRYVPPGGALFDKYRIPGGVHIGASIFVYHRWDKDLWGSPELADHFYPERWLLEDAEKLKRMNSLLYVFPIVSLCFAETNPDLRFLKARVLALADTLQNSKFTSCWQHSSVL